MTYEIHRLTEEIESCCNCPLVDIPMDDCNCQCHEDAYKRDYYEDLRLQDEFNVDWQAEIIEMEDL